MWIRDVEVDRGLVLAPMEGVTDVTFRRLIKQVGGAGLVYTEFVPARGLAENIARARRTAEFDDDHRPIAVQVYGRDPVALAEGARVAEDLGADIVDLNMGCPSKRVTKRSGGSGLMREPELAQQIVRAMRAAVSVPFTVKMRAGWDRSSVNAPEIAWMCQEEGADGVIVHWRTKEEAYAGTREVGPVAEVKAKLSIPVLFNGDVIDAESARRALDETGCDGLMIGRGAIRNPWVFHEIRHALWGEPAVVPDATEKERVLLGYYAALRPRFHTDRAALGRMKKIARYFADGLPEGQRLRQAIFHSQTIEEAENQVRSYFDWLRAVEAGTEPAAPSVA